MPVTPRHIRSSVRGRWHEGARRRQVAGVARRARWPVAAAALALAVGTLVGEPATATGSVHPHPGHYEGTDTLGQWVTFTFDHGSVHHFRTAHGPVATIHVDADGRWQRTCQHDVCVRGHWTSPTHAQGSWRGEETDWIAWSMDSAEGGIVPSAGDYVGALREDRQARVEFRYAHWAVHHVSGPAHFPLAPVDQEVPSFQHCGETRCVQGHWESSFWVVGVWRRLHEDTWHHWYAGLVAEPDEPARP